MSIIEYCGEHEYAQIQFIFRITNEIKEKVHEKKLFYQEQIIRFVRKQIDLFLQNRTCNIALLTVYKNEMYQSIMFKLQTLLKENQILRCI